MTRKLEKTDILIVNDDTEHRLYLKEILGNQEYRIIEAENGKEALDLIQIHDFAAVILDMKLPDMYGSETAEKIRLRKKARHVPIMFLTDTVEDEPWVFKGCMTGAVDYMIKPVDPVIIVSKVKVFAELHKLRKSSEQRAEEILKMTDTNYRILFDTSMDGIAFLSLDGQIEKANKAYCDMFGYSEHELMLMTYHQYTPRKWITRDLEILEKQVLTRGFSDEYRKEFMRRDKSVFPAMVRIQLVRGTEGEPLRLITIVRDVTDHTRLENQLRQAQKMEAIGTLAGGIAHDFNNILGAIIGYAQLARYNIKDPDKTLANIEHVMTASNRAKDLVRHILGFSRLTEHRIQPLQLHLIVKEVLKLIRASLPTTIEIRQDIATEGTAIMADPTEIHQILMNFCTNSLHAMENTGGILEVNLKPVELTDNTEEILEFPELKHGRYIRLSVSDTGCGIEKHNIDRIFDPYFTTKEKGAGTGLGLAVVHGIIKNNGGAVKAKSTPGKNTVMTVMLPRLEAKVENREQGITHLPGGNETILFVDDEKSLVEIEEMMLQRLGYRVVSETSSLKAFNIFINRSDDFDIVITDMTMPGMTGLELARGIKAIRQDVPIILCTGYNNKITTETAREAGISKVLIKPLEIREFAQSIRELLDKQKDAFKRSPEV